MNELEVKDEQIHVYVTKEQKQQVHFLAQICGKSDSQYLLDSGLNQNNDTFKANNYNTLEIDITYLKQTAYVITKLCMAILNVNFDDPEEVKKFAADALEEAERYFKRKEKSLTSGE